MISKERIGSVILYFVQNSDLPCYATAEVIEEMDRTMEWGPFNHDLRKAIECRYRTLTGTDLTKQARA